jgi:hypothetical protein
MVTVAAPSMAERSAWASSSDEITVRYMSWFIAAAWLLPLPAAAQQQQPVEWAKLPRMQLERQFAAPLQDTVIQRWRDSVDGTICYIYLPITVVHSAPTASGYVQYGPNTVGSMSCVAASAAVAPPGTSAFTGTMLVSLIIQLVAGIAGGNAAGAALRGDSPGIVGNTIAGALGGLSGGQLLQVLVPAISGAGDGLDLGAILGQTVGGGVGGATLALIAGLVKGIMARR